MKQVYGDVQLKSGATNAGISKIQLAPKDWLAADLIIDFSTGAISTAISLIAGKSFFELQFAPLSYDYDEKVKTVKNNPAIETTIGGHINDLDKDQLQIIETLRRSELICIATDRQRRKRIVGNQEYGMLFSFENKNANNPNGNQKAQVSLIFNSESFAPFYTA
jgi:hypothetical protein